MNSPPPSLLAGSCPPRASPLKRSRAERSEDAPAGSEREQGDRYFHGVVNEDGSAQAHTFVYQRPQFPPPPPPPVFSSVPQPQSLPLTSADQLGEAENARLSASTTPLRHVASAVVSPMARSVNVVPYTATHGDIHSGRPRTAGVGATGGSGMMSAGQRKKNKPEGADYVRHEKDRTPSLCLAPDTSEAQETELVASWSTTTSLSRSSASWTRDASAERGVSTPRHSDSERRAHRPSPHAQPVCRNKSTGGTLRRPAPAPFASQRSTLESHSSARTSAAASTSSQSRSSSSSRSSNASSVSTTSGSSSGTAAEKEDRAKHYPRFTPDYAQSFRHDLVPFLLSLSRPPDLVASGPARDTDAQTATGRGAEHGAARAPTQTSSDLHGRAKTWIASLFNLTTPKATSPSSLRATTTAAAVSTAAPHSTPPTRSIPSDSTDSRLVLYNHYVYLRTLGKGTFSKVVAVQPVSAQGTGNAETVALKIFRDEDIYREACWDEVTILNTLCQSFAARVSATVRGGPQQPGTVTSSAVAIPPTVLMSVAPHAAAAPASLGGALDASTPCLDGRPGVDPVVYDGRFLAPLGYIPHPVHPAILYPMLGPSLLHVMRGIKMASRQRAAEGHEKEKVRAMAAAAAATHSPGPYKKGVVYLRGLPLALVRAVLYQALQCLCFAHECGVVHTDLKPENILFESAEMERTDVAVFSLNLDAPSTAALERAAHHTDAGAIAATGSSVSHRKQWNDAAKLHSARSSVRRQDGTRANTGQAMEDSFPSFPSLPSGGAGTPGYAPDPRYCQNRHLQHTLTVPLPQHNGVRVVDLGSARLVSRFRFGCRYDEGWRGQTPGTGISREATLVSYEPIQTSHYRSPEVVLDLGWHASADIFSLGCMIPELVTGDCLFMPNDSFEHLAMMEHVIGPFFGAREATSTAARQRMERFLRCNPRTFEHYFHDNDAQAGHTAPPRIRWPWKAEEVKRFEAAHVSKTSAHASQKPPPSSAAPSPSAPFTTTIQQDIGRNASELSTPEVTTRDDVRFVREKPTLKELLAHCPALLDLAEKMLLFHPHERITAAEALKHPFFQL